MTMTERPTDTGRAIIAREDVEAASNILDAWLVEHIATSKVSEDFLAELQTVAPYLRGLITQALADAHAQGYEQGITRGRRQIGNSLRDLLDGEGL